MNWFQSLDTASFRLVNQSMANPLLDAVMPLLAGHPLFAPALVVSALWLAWKGGVRGRLCIVMLVLVGGGANNLLTDWLKHAFERPRPFLELPDARVLVGQGGSFSMPSSHASNWFAAATVLWVYYRRSLWLMLPIAASVGFSRVYTGVHYPADVIAGAALGVGVGLVGMWFLDSLWRVAGPRAFPLWWRSLPSLRAAEYHPDPLVRSPDPRLLRDPEAARERQWLRLGYLVIGLLLLARLAYLAAGRIELSEDEAYQWLWSKHLALSYYSKPPMIAYTQWLGTRIWGDTEFGIRFFSPLISALLGAMILRFFAREFTARTGFWLVLIVSATPLLAVGSVLMTVDPLSVLFWTAAMLAGWRAVQKEGRTRDWAWLGVWMGFGFLSKYTALFQWLSFAIFLSVSSAARQHLRRPGPYLAVAINALCALPVVWWNARHGWITVRHLGDRAGLGEVWAPTSRFLVDFTLAEVALLNPVFFGAILWASVSVLRKRRQNSLLMYLLCMGLPLFAGYWLYTLRARVQPNWIAPAVLPLLCLTVAYAESRWRAGVRSTKGWFIAGLAIGLPAVILCHETGLIRKITGHALPPALDPLRRVRGWRETATVVGDARRTLLEEGKPVFLIGDHYGTSGLLSFYVPEARAGVPDHPMVYYLSSDRPLNQFYFWPGYGARKGENALFVRQCTEPEPPPDSLPREFASVTDMGMFDVIRRGTVLRRLQIYACRDLR